MAKKRDEKNGKKVKSTKARKRTTKKEKTPEGKVHVYDLKGKSKKIIGFPSVFDLNVRKDLIHRAVVASRANRRQPYGPMHRAGMRHSVEWWGKGRGVSRVPRKMDSRTAAQAPNVVGGRRAFPPKPERNWSKKINKKERNLACRCAIAALRDKDLVKTRGHRFHKDLSLPVVMVDDLEKLKTARSVVDALTTVGVYEDVQRAKDGIKIRAGRGKMRSRRYRRPKSLLIIVKEKGGIERAANNLPGVDIVTVDQLNAELLAPGGSPGRLSIFSESAFKSLGGK